MLTRFTIEGMHCSSCEAKLTDALSNVPGVRKVSVSLEKTEATLELDYPVNLSAIDSAVRERVEYRIQSPGDEAKEVPSSEPKESFDSLILIVAYLAVTVLAVAWSLDVFSWPSLMRHFMAGFFLVFSFFKFLDLRGFVDAYRGYDILAKSTPIWAWLYPFIELSLGIAYIINAYPTITNLITLILMLVGAIGVIRALQKKQTIRCACLGTALNLPMTKVTLIEDLVMAAMAGAMLLLN